MNYWMRSGRKPMYSPRCCGRTCWTCERYLETIQHVRASSKPCPNVAIVSWPRLRMRARLNSGAASARETQPAIPDAIVGREQELIRLKTLGRRWLADSGKRSSLPAPTGIGKTALVEAACQLMVDHVVGQRGQRSMRGRAQQEGRLLLRHGNPATALRFRSRGNRRPGFSRARAGMAGCAPPANLTQPQDARSSQPKAPGDLCRALEELAKEKALVLVFEDLQWANDSTLELISALARRRTPAKLMLLATYSSHYASAEHPLKALNRTW